MTSPTENNSNQWSAMQVQFENLIDAPTYLAPPAVCVVGAAPLEETWIADRCPEVVLTLTRHDGHPTGAEYLRFKAVNALQFLPSLSQHRAPSRLKDTVALLLNAGAPHVDVLIGRGPQAKPWDLLEENVFDGLERHLAEMHGTTLLFPDLNGAPETWPGSTVDFEAILARFRLFARRFQVRLTERYQVAILDLPRLADDKLLLLEETLVGLDVSLAGWSGSLDGLQRHRWRSAAAAAATTICQSQGAVDQAITGRVVSLSQGRQVVGDRRPVLQGYRGALQPIPHPSRIMNIAIDKKGLKGNIQSAPIFRRPLGSWTLSSVRAVKAIHQAVREAASQYVFESTTPDRAVALAAAIQFALLPFVNDGLLAGPNGEQQPDVIGHADPNPSCPSLIATIVGELRPWSREVRVKISLRPNAETDVEINV